MLMTLASGVLILLLVMGLLAPYETLGWWGGWYGDDIEAELNVDALEAHSPPSQKQHFVVYLTGIGGTSPSEYSHLEKNFLEALRAKLPEVELVDDIFPYSSGNRALTGERFFAWFWRALKNLKGRGRLGAIGFLINVRNLWQVLVSSDRRFGPIYNSASAQMIYKTLLEHGYRVHSGVPITLIGYSGGGQIATGTAPILEEAVKARVHVISLGGVMSSSQFIHEIDSLTHLYGSKDSTQRLGYILFPARWSFFPWTVWNQARRKGIIRRVPMGAMVHTGKNGYLDPEARLETGQSFLEKTVETIANIAREHNKQGVKNVPWK